jgi:hypothetical protein
MGSALSEKTAIRSFSVLKDLLLGEAAVCFYELDDVA